MFKFDHDVSVQTYLYYISKGAILGTFISIAYAAFAYGQPLKGPSHDTREIHSTIQNDHRSNLDADRQSRATGWPKLR